MRSIHSSIILQYLLLFVLQWKELPCHLCGYE